MVTPSDAKRLAQHAGRLDLTGAAEGRDALIMAVAADNHCRFLLTEDLQSGFTWRGVTVINPFTQTENRFGTTFEGGTLHDKTINGIPGPGTAQKIISSYSQPSFSIERTVRPEKRILLSRP